MEEDEELLGTCHPLIGIDVVFSILLVFPFNGFDQWSQFCCPPSLCACLPEAGPYPAHMDDLSSTIFYSTWNQSIAMTVKRNLDIKIYHINDYHGTPTPIRLLPKVLPVCLPLHNTEFQSLWPLRMKEEVKEVCSACVDPPCLYHPGFAADLGFCTVVLG